ncbi:DUF962 domain-containing protein [Paenibacillus thermotolerans]|uniref:DUF962 domain-containing protein n=1 Tax=Paenibacillus thermotolerans TaxID=3027807 RepID=UPI0023683A64|nr:MULTISPECIES: DUF962 domain-containing protein [unclassified Paenibacillus]
MSNTSFSNIPQFNSFEQFWPYYLQQHSKPLTRILHFIGTDFVFVAIILAIVLHPAYILLAPVVAYGFAWFSHFLIEGNKPATFGHPIWSLIADFKMWFYIASGQINKELARLNIAQ